MKTKREIASDVLLLAREIHASDDDYEDIDTWLLRLEWICEDLDPAIRDRRYYTDLLGDRPKSSRRSKLRNLIDHPATGEHERAAALRALHALK